MSRFWHVFLSLIVGSFFSRAFVLVVLIFWPLLFPESLSGPTPGEDAGALAMIAAMLLGGLAGFTLCWRLMSRYVRKDEPGAGKRLTR